jgi:hypothetical protein
MSQASASLVGRVAAFIGQEQRRSAGQAHDAADTILHQVALDVRTDLGAFLAQGRPEDEQHRRLAYWLEEQFWNAIDPDSARVLRSVKATREEIEVLTMG